MISSLLQKFEWVFANRCTCILIYAYMYYLADRLSVTNVSDIPTRGRDGTGTYKYKIIKTYYDPLTVCKTNVLVVNTAVCPRMTVICSDYNIQG